MLLYFTDVLCPQLYIVYIMLNVQVKVQIVHDHNNTDKQLILDIKHTLANILNKYNSCRWK